MRAGISGAASTDYRTTRQACRSDRASWRELPFSASNRRDSRNIARRGFSSRRRDRDDQPLEFYGRQPSPRCLDRGARTRHKMGGDAETRRSAYPSDYRSLAPAAMSAARDCSRSGLVERDYRDGMSAGEDDSATMRLSDHMSVTVSNSF